MQKEEFFQSFQEALVGEVSEGIIQDNVNYYRSYIDEEIRKGRSEYEVLNSLGNPRLLAKTIINTSGINSSSSYSDSTRAYENYYSQGSDYSKDQDHRTWKQKIRELEVPTWLRKLLSVVVILGVIALTFTVISYLAPVFLFIACIVIVVKIIKNICGGS